MSPLSFGRLLKQFTFAVDIVDDSMIRQVGRLVKEFVQQELRVEFFEVMKEGRVSDREGLHSLWSTDNSREGNFSEALTTTEGEPENQVTYAVANRTPLWIVAEDKEELSENQDLVDLWSQADDFTFCSRTDYGHPKTAIVVPVRWGSLVFGAMYLESGEYLEITAVAQQELETLAEATAVLCSNHQSSNHSRRSSEQAIDQLAQTLRNATLPQLTKPQVFVAGPSDGDPAVTGLIQEVVDEYSDLLNPVYWRSFNTSGAVDRMIAEAIVGSKFAVCYLSEPTDSDQSDDYRFQDNANVLFEAGMVQGLNGLGDVTGWIPVREEESPAPPFDIAGLLIEYVPRNNDGTLNKESFRHQMRDRVEALLDR